MTNRVEKHTWTFGFLGVGLIAALVFMVTWGVLASKSTAIAGLDGPVPDEPVEVSVNDGVIEMPDSLTAGTVTLAVTNSSQQQAHGLVLTGPIEEKGLEGLIAPGQSDTLKVELEPGTYTAYCPVDGHRESTGFIVGR